MILPMNLSTHMQLMCILHRQGNIRLAEQIAYHLSKTITDDNLVLPLNINGITVAYASARYVLITNMKQLGIIK